MRLCTQIGKSLSGTCLFFLNEEAMGSVWRSGKQHGVFTFLFDKALDLFDEIEPACQDSLDLLRVKEGRQALSNFILIQIFKVPPQLPGTAKNRQFRDQAMFRNKRL